MQQISHPKHSASIQLGKPLKSQHISSRDKTRI